jgi:hypothetical protein
MFRKGRQKRNLIFIKKEKARQKCFSLAYICMICEIRLRSVKCRCHDSVILFSIATTMQELKRFAFEVEYLSVKLCDTLHNRTTPRSPLSNAIARCDACPKRYFLFVRWVYSSIVLMLHVVAAVENRETFISHCCTLRSYRNTSLYMYIYIDLYICIYIYIDTCMSHLISAINVFTGLKLKRLGHEVDGQCTHQYAWSNGRQQQR